MRVDRLLGEHGENHSGELHRETAEQKANRILSEELSRRGWPESDLAVRRRSDPGKLVIAVRLRNETTLPVKWIAARVQIGTAKGAKSVLHRSGRGQHQHKPARADEPCAQLEFQSTVDPFPVWAGARGRWKTASVAPAGQPARRAAAASAGDRWRLTDGNCFSRARSY